MAEILAPAGGWESLEAAVRSGADAVYLGLKSLNARKNAENFTAEELSSACRYCHERGVSVYLAVNTLIKDNEWDTAYSAANAAADAGVDALITADLGLIRFFKAVVPHIPIHASTQCSVFSEYGARILEDMGVKRIVLARELSLDEIDKIKRSVSTELEAFVHGASCMSVSGQCLFSSFLGGRSGNRGLCAGTCRLPFFSQATKEEYALSLKDLSLYDRISALEDIGITSFKIEGRMKRPEYVSAATKSLRNILDGKGYDRRLLESVFSRNGFSSGYFDSRLDSDMFGKREKEDVTAAPPVFSQIHEYYKRELQRIPLCAEFVLRLGSAKLTLRDGNGNTASAETTNVSPAIKTSVDEYIIREKTEKLGGTPFYLENFTAETDSGLYISVKDINALKTACVYELLKKRGAVRRQAPKDYAFSSSPVKKDGIKKRYVYLPHYSAEIADKFDKIFIDIDKITPDCERDKTVIVLPRYFTPATAEKLREKLTILENKGFIFAAADNLNSLGLLKGFGFKIIGTGGLNILNSESVKTLEELGIDELILSVENSFSTVNKMKSNIPLGVILYGYTPLMLTRTCPVTMKRDCKNCKVKGGALRDRLGEVFPQRCSEEYSEILNSRPLWLIDKADRFSGAETALYDLRNSDLSEILKNILLSSPPTGKFTLGLYNEKLI